MKNWNIYHRDREFAFVHGDPLLGNVEADTQEEAERIATGRGLGGHQAGLLAVLAGATLELRCARCGAVVAKTFPLTPAGWHPDDAFPIKEGCLGCGATEWETSDEDAGEIVDKSVEAFNASRPFPCPDGEHTYE